MEKSLYSRDNQILCGLLKALRKEADLTQDDVAKRLDWPQACVSRYETGERRLDPVELYAVCNALEISFMEFAEYRRYRRPLF